MHQSIIALGIDLGGTNLRIGVMDQAGRLLDFASQTIDPTLDGDGMVNEIYRLASGLSQADKIQAVGIALAGSVRPGGGMIPKGLTNIPGIEGYPMEEKLGQVFDRPCVMDNDALLALLGECRYGIGRGYRDVLILTLGTGIGGGLLLNGIRRRGSHGIGWEAGMLPFPDPTISNLTPFEQLASPKALMRRLGDPNGLLYERAAAGDSNARHAIASMYRYLGWLVSCMQLSFDLQLVILSGGLASVGQPLVEGVRQTFKEICPPELQFDLQIELGSLPEHAAGVIGAASLAIDPDWEDVE
jgi:glucokinase